MAKKEKYLLTYPANDIDKIVKEYINDTYPDCSCRVKDNGIGKKIEITKDHVTSLLNLTINGGQLSHFTQGKEEYKGICEKCWQKIVEHLPLVSEISTWLSIKDVSKENEESFVDELDETEGLEIERMGNKDMVTNTVLRIKNNEGSSVTLTYYTNETLMIQGRVSSLFVWMQNILLSQYVDNASKIKEIYSNLHISGLPLYSDNIEELIDNPSQLKGCILETLLMTTIKLANSKIVVDDYGCYIMGMCRAIEGLMVKKFSENGHVFQSKETWTNCFDCDATTETHYVKASFTDICSKPSLKSAIENCYEFIKNKRNRSFHVDKGNLEATTIISSLDEVKEIIDDGLEVINNLCNNW